MSYLYLAIAIVGEVVATSALKRTEQFTRLAPSLAVVGGYLVAFYFLTLVLQHMPVGIAYAIWCGMGVVLVAAAGAALNGEIPDLPALAGMTLIIAGVVIMNVFSKSVSH